MTLTEAKQLEPGDIIYHAVFKNADGTKCRYKVNGMVKLWKTMPNRICVPLKHGLYKFDYLTESNLDQFTIKEN